MTRTSALPAVYPYQDTNRLVSEAIAVSSHQVETQDPESHHHNRSGLRLLSGRPDRSDAHLRQTRDFHLRRRVPARTPAPGKAFVPAPVCSPLPCGWSLSGGIRIEKSVVQRFRSSISDCPRYPKQVFHGIYRCRSGHPPGKRQQLSPAAGQGNDWARADSHRRNHKGQPLSGSPSNFAPAASQSATTLISSRQGFCFGILSERRLSSVAATTLHPHQRFFQWLDAAVPRLR